jgi:hypothetical protein
VVVNSSASSSKDNVQSGVNSGYKIPINQSSTGGSNNANAKDAYSSSLPKSKPFLQRMVLKTPA